MFSHIYRVNSFLDWGHTSTKNSSSPSNLNFGSDPSNCKFARCTSFAASSHNLMASQDRFSAKAAKRYSKILTECCGSWSDDIDLPNTSPPRLKRNGGGLSQPCQDSFSDWQRFLIREASAGNMGDVGRVQPKSSYVYSSFQVKCSLINDGKPSRRASNPDEWYPCCPLFRSQSRV